MKAVGYRQHGLPVDDPRDVKSRRAIPATADQPMVLGYDGSGIVEAIGPEAVLFRLGDAVFYAGGTEPARFQCRAATGG